MLKFSSAPEAHLYFLQVQVSVDEGSGLPVIVPVAIRKGGEGAAEERKNQVRYLFLVVALMVSTQTLGIILPFCFQENYDSPTFDYDRRTLGCDEHMHGGLAQAEGQASSPPSSHLKVHKILNIVPGEQ